MTFAEFKDELYLLKINRQVMRSIIEDLKTYAADQLSTVFSGAIDYSKDKIQHQSDPDAAIINVLMKIDADVDRLKKKFDQLEQENEELEEVIFKGQGLGGEFIRLYYIEGLSMSAIADRFGYSRQWCYELWDKELKRLYREVLENE